MTIIPPQFLPMIVAGVMPVLMIRNRRKRRRGPARVSTAGTRTRSSSPGGMDGEGYFRNHSRTSITR
jgi:hypothetical protein